MITDDDLRDLLDVAADSFPPPVDGVERILVKARQPVPPAYARRFTRLPRLDTHRWQVGLLSLGAACLVGVLIAVAVLAGGGRHPRSSTASSGAAVNAPAASSASAGTAQGAGGQSSARSATPIAPSVAAPVPGSTARLATEAEVQVDPGHLPAAVTQLQALAARMGGQVTGTVPAAGAGSASVTVQLPAGRLDQFRSQLGSIGTVVTADSLPVATSALAGSTVNLTVRLIEKAQPGPG